MDDSLIKRLEKIEAELEQFRSELSKIGKDIDRPLKAIRDGYYETALTNAGSIIEEILREMWRKKGISGDPEKKTIEQLFSVIKNQVSFDRLVEDYIRDIQLARNRAAHDSKVVDEDSLEVLRKLSKVLHWYFSSFLGMETIQSNAIKTTNNKSKNYILDTSEETKCPNCNKPINQAWTICPFCKVNLKKEKSKCKKCRKDIEDDWDVCPFCGENNYLKIFSGLDKNRKIIIQKIIDSMIKIEGGVFKMGDEDSDPIHKVELDSFEILSAPITQDQYKAIIGKNPSFFKKPDNPVERVCWYDAFEFCKKLSELTGYNFRLPTEAEWEYACRAGTTTTYFFGNEWRDLDKFAWYFENSNEKTHPVRTKKSNPWGLFDMLGNVYEWCSDWFNEDYYKNSPRKNPKGPATGQEKVYRGGAWSASQLITRSAFRGYDDPSLNTEFIGFRCVRTN